MAYKNFKATEIIEEIGAELRKIRANNNQTISHVAIELTENGLHISNTLLGRIENGERRIDDDTLNAICHYYIPRRPCWCSGPRIRTLKIWSFPGICWRM